MKKIFFLFSLLLLGIYSHGQTILNPGDLVILGVDANLGGNPDEISFACFKDITTGTEIQITDQGYERCNAGLWGSGEGGAKLTRTGGTIAAGTVITFKTSQSYSPYITFTYPDTLWAITDLGSGAPANSFNLNSGGDQVYFAQGGTWTSGTLCSNSYPGAAGRMLFAFSTSGAWDNTFANSTQKSALYPGMTCYNMAPTGGASDFVKYTGPLTAATQKDWITRIGTTTNWSKFTTSALYLSGSPDLHTTVLPIIAGTDADWTSPAPICQSASSINLNTLITGLSGGTWSGTGVTGNIFNPSGLSGPYNITYTVDCPCCISQTHTITVNPSPTVAAPSNVTVCNNGTVAATNFVSTPVGATFTWTNSNTAIGLAASGSGNISSFTATNTGTAPITATITVTPTTTCAGISSNYTITVNPTPTVAVPSNIVVCNGGTVNGTSFTSPTTGTTFTWTNSNTAISLAASGSGNIGSFTATNTGSTPITATISVTPSANTCTGTPSTYTITVNPSPTVAVPSNITVCNNGNVPATNFISTPAGGTFAWTNSNTAIGLAASGTGNIGSFTATNTTSAPITATISVTPTASTCTGTPSTYTITVNPTDNPAFNYTPSSLCQSGSDPAANITGGSSGTFSASPSGLIFLDNTTGLIDLSASAINTYTVTFNTTGLCPTSSTQVITISTAPLANFSYPGSYCPYDVDPLPVFGIGAGAGVFSAAPSGLVFVNPSTGEVNLASSTPGTYTVTNTIAASGGCAATSANTTITINPVPAATASSNSAICAGATLNLTSGGGTGYSWSGPNSFTSSNQNPSITNATTSASGTYTVTVTNGSGCTASAQTAVTVNATPTATASSNSAICAGATLNLTSGGGTTYSWSGPNSFTSTDQNPSIASVATAATGTYTVTVTNAQGCSDTKSISVVIHPLPSVTLTIPNNIYCVDASPVTLSGTPSGGILSGQGISGNTFNPSVAGIGNDYPIIYIYTDANSCTNSDTVWVTVSDIPLVDLQMDITSQIYLGQEVTFTANPGNYDNYNFYIDNISVQNSASNIYQTSVLQNGQIIYVIASDNGCIENDSIILDVKQIPNAFIPDGSPENQVYLKGMDLQIMNRWGQELYKGKDGWDGKYAGQLVSPGTYYYVIKLTDSKTNEITTRQGSVTVVKK